MEALWDLIARPTLNLRADEASLARAAHVFQVGLLRETAAGDVGWATAPLSEIHDRPARRALAGAGVEVRLRTRVERVTRDGGAGWTVHGPDGGLAADAVVVARPPRPGGRPAPRGRARRPRGPGGLGGSPIVNLHVIYDRPVTRLPLAAAVRSPVQWVFDRTASGGLASGQYLAVSLSAAAEEMAMTQEALRARFEPALAELFPAAREARVERFLVTREHAATFRAEPGSGARRAGARSLLPGLELAGAWTDTGWPATMEGAVRSGASAAGAVLASLDRPRQAVAA